MADDETPPSEHPEPPDSYWPLVKILAGVLACVLIGGVGLPLLDASHDVWNEAGLLVSGVLGWGFALLAILCG